MPGLPDLHRAQRGLRSDDVQELQTHLLLVLLAEPGRKFSLEEAQPLPCAGSVPRSGPCGPSLSLTIVQKELGFLSEVS